MSEHLSEQDLNAIINDMENIDAPKEVDVPLFQQTGFEQPFSNDVKVRQTSSVRLNAVDEDTTVIGTTTVVSSNITCGGNIEVKGQVLGKITVSGTAVISGLVEGDIEASELIINPGVKVTGNLDVKNDLTVAAGSTVTGNIAAKNARINSVVNGNVSAANDLTLEENAEVYGDLSAKKLAVEAGAMLEGGISIKHK